MAPAWRLPELPQPLLGAYRELDAVVKPSVFKATAALGWELKQSTRPRRPAARAPEPCTSLPRR